MTQRPIENSRAHDSWSLAPRRPQGTTRLGCIFPKPVYRRGGKIGESLDNAEYGIHWGPLAMNRMQAWIGALGCLVALAGTGGVRAETPPPRPLRLIPDVADVVVEMKR